jgi:hypothetical protein
MSEMEAIKVPWRDHAPRPHDPFRSPNWRWERARWLRENSTNTKSYDDDAVKLAKNYQTAMVLYGRSKEGQEKIREDFPEIYHAYKIYVQEGGLDYQAHRWSLEARVLANEDREAIAHKLRSSPSVIHCYEMLFFDVRDYLTCTDWISNNVLGRSIHDGVADRNYGLLWKLLGYAYGPHMVDALVVPATNPAHVSGPEQINSVMGNFHKGNVYRKSAIASATMPVWNNQFRIMEAHARILEAEKDKEGGSQTQSMLVDNLETCLKAIRLSVGMQMENRGAFAIYDQHGVELRSEEMLTAALSGKPEIYKQILEQRFPEPEPLT